MFLLKILNYKVLIEVLRVYYINILKLECNIKYMCVMLMGILFCFKCGVNICFFLCRREDVLFFCVSLVL